MEIDNLKGLRDFIITYNQIADECFNYCVYNFNNRNLSNDEELCLHNCTKRFVSSQTRLSRGFADYQMNKLNQANQVPK
ncbi:unnamed protein product [Brachionus calyciflorus]|uniref:Mitochondrial import inner membrane translocase subunit n=1 Tax=Brachionus calyciflorus TaxID=104777 RepID=A0A813RI34_9BILA|nr:unnamed protein product [Brachionus calyciflorus]